MKYLAIVLAGVLMISCSKEQGPASDLQPEEADNEKSMHSEANTSASDQPNEKLGEVVRVTYIVESDGPINSGKFSLDGEEKSFCGDDDFQFSFETMNQQELSLKAVARKNNVNNLVLKVLINGQVVKKTNAEEIDLFKEGDITYNLDSLPNAK